MISISEPYFRAIQKAALSGIWSKGVALARDGAVILDASDGEEIRLRVKTPGRTVSSRVTLWPNSDPEDEDWHCDCGDRNELCMHIVAAAVALKNSQLAQEETQASAGRVEYRFRRQDRALVLERLIRRGEAREPLTGSLVSLAGGIGSGRIAAPAVPATKEDFAIDPLVGSGRISPENVSALFKLLKECPAVFLDDQAIHVSTQAIRPRATIVDEGAGFRLKASRDSGIIEAFSNGIVLHEGALKPWEPADLPQEFKKLLEGEGTFFGRADVAILVSEVLPALEGRIAIEIQSARLPQLVAAQPRIELRLESEGPETLGVTATLVYGDPAIAEVTNDRILSRGGKTLPVRDPATEKSLLRSLQSELNLRTGERVKFEGLAAVEFARRAKAFSSRQPSTTIGGGLSAFSITRTIQPKIVVVGESIEVDFDGADPARVFQAWRTGESFVPLLGGGWAPLPSDWLSRYGERVLALIEARGRGSLPAYRMPEIAALLQETGDPMPVSLQKLSEMLTSFERIPDVVLPADLQADLRPYQRQGINWLSFLRDAGMGALLADDMGLGKTLQALAVLRGRTLVIAPTSVLRAWEEQAGKFRPGLSVSMYYGAARRLSETADLVITSYGVLRLDQDLLAGADWDTVILDESQTIKNPESQIARAAHRLKARFRIALSGTPVENHLLDLWSQFQFLNPGILASRSDFQDQFATPISSGDTRAAQSLRRLIKPFLLRRLKREVATELPPRTETVLECELSESERAIYDAVMAATRAEALRALGAGEGAIAALEALLRLRQACCHPALLPGQTAETSSKVELLVETLQESIENGHRALIFSQWTSLLDLVQARLARESIRFSRLDGATRDRAAVVDAFQRDDGPSCMLISLKAGGVGLTLTAADHVFILDPWWNPAAENQAADRAHRIGQENPVLIHRLVARDSVEEKILDLQKRKTELAGAALEGSAAAVSLTRADFEALLI
ncbi:MAG: SNF2-related protein [Oligoflexia bacterium]|nr:SNF2-related protein [Oligoflexia bacterium]